MEGFMDAWISMCNMLIRNYANLSVYQIESSQIYFGVIIRMWKSVQSKVNCFSGFSAFKT